MSRRKLALLSVALVTAMITASLVAGSRLPADLRLPVHWGLSGEPDRFAGKWAGLLMPAAMTAVLSLFFWFLPMLEPRGRNLLRSQGLYLWAWGALLVMSIAIQTAVFSAAFQLGFPVNRLLAGAFGVMFVMIGNQLGKSRSMFMMGLRTPWTLASEESWMRANRLAGKLMVLGGLVSILAAFLPLAPGLLAIILGGTIAVAAVIPLVYSFLLWRREPRPVDDPPQE